MPASLSAPLLALALLLPACDDGKPAGSGIQDARVSLSVDPPEGGQGTSLTVDIRATQSVFSFDGTTVDFGDGVTVDAVQVLDGWSLEADVTIAEDAALGGRDVAVSSAGNTRTVEEGFAVIAESFRVEPESAMLGETVEVTFTGRNTDWEGGETWPTFGEGVSVREFTVVTGSLAVATISVDADTWAGPRDVLVETGTDVTYLHDGFLVDRAGLAAGFDPGVVEQGEEVVFSIEGRGTAFRADETELAFIRDGAERADIVVDTITVQDATHLYGRMTVSNAAQIGFWDVLVSSGEEGVVINDAFEVVEGELDLTEVAVYLVLEIVRAIDNSTGQVGEQVTALVMFYVPLDPPCGGGGAMGSGPQPYDNNGVFPYPEASESTEDCPDPRTVGAGDFVWLESDVNTITMERVEDPYSGLIYYYGFDLTADDYAFGYWYDLHTQGEEGGLREYLLEDVQPTVPADFQLLTPSLWNDFTWNRAEDFTYTWTPAQTYPDAVFVTGISGTLASTGKGGFVGSIPWDDGVHTYTAAELSQLTASPVDFYAYSYIEGPTFGLPDSIYQENETESLLYLGAYMVLE